MTTTKSTGHGAFTNDEKIDAMQSCLGESRGQCDPRGRMHWDWLEEFRAALSSASAASRFLAATQRAEPVAQSGVEGLREALESIAENTCCDRCQEAALVARAALNAAPPAADTWQPDGRNDGMRFPEESDTMGGETDCARTDPAAEVSADVLSVFEALASDNPREEIDLLAVERLAMRADTRPAAPLSEGRAMGVYMDFDRTADKAWTPAEYMVKFAQFVSASPSPQQTDEATDAGLDFEQAARPLIKWLSENVHPHHTAIVTNDSAELLEGAQTVRTNEFIKD